MRANRASVLLALLSAPIACSTRGPATVNDLSSTTSDSAPTTNPDRPLGGDGDMWVGPPRPDLARRVDGKPVTSPDYGMCMPCKSGEGYFISPCVSTDKLFTCATLCKVGASNQCPIGFTCDQWGATPCCICSAAVAACVPNATPGKIIGPLRINPTSGVAGQKITLTITGAPFYIGALFYNVRIGGDIKMEEPSAAKCSIGASFTPPKPGIYAVEVSQYGGGPPWVLAGFYTATAGAPVVPTIQPGYQCSMNPAPGDPACISAPPYTCKCVTGRCTCQ